MKVVDLFSGCGGLSLGLKNAGFDVLAAFENWEPAIKVYRENFNHPVNSKDLNDSESIEIIRNFKPEMIAGGPPCQDFSSAGKRDESLGRADLTIRFSEILSRIKPEWFLMENVERAYKSQALKVALENLKKTGYGITINILDSSYCGVPQIRKRMFVIGHLGSEDNFLYDYLENGLANKQMTIFDYLGNSIGVEYYYRHPRSYKRRGVFSIHEPSPTVRGVNRPIPKSYKKHQGDPIDINEGVRPLTTIERSYLQTFPNTFKFSGSKTDLEQMIGNAVPIKLAEYVGRSILNYKKDFLNKTVKKKSFQMNLHFDFSESALSL
jgi:DNA (cytosine-5)-methyltransferase 1